MSTARLVITTVVAAGALACSDEDTSSANTGTIARPQTFAFASRFDPSQSSVSYTGQTQRHMLIEEMKAYIGGIDDQTAADTIAGSLRYYYDFKNEGGSATTPIDFSPSNGLPALQQTWGDIGSPVSLKDKFPEFDADFAGNVVGYKDGTLTPEEALLAMFADLQALVEARAIGPLPTDPSGADIAKAYVNADGVDFQQLIQKYLGGAIALSQGADDYLDDDIPGKGLLSDNEMPVEGRLYTALEHVWDEGFGYFGAARNFAAYSDNEIAGSGEDRAEWQGAYDTDQDGSIDLTAEQNFGHAVNAAKRDRGAVVPTDYTQEAFDAFLDGRTLIVNAGGALNDEQLEQLREYRDIAVGAWERAIAATAVHYVNDVLQDMNAFDTPEYSFLDHAKHWSELKGFSLALQFNVNHSPLTESPTALAELHGYIGDKPVLPTASMQDRTDYRAALVSAKTLLGTIYGFDAANLGDANGENGW